MTFCAVDGCQRTDIRSRGWCHMHYRRWERHGSPLIVLQQRDTRMTPFARARRDAGLTLREVATRTGLALSTIHHYDVGDRRPSRANAHRVAEAIGADADTLWPPPVCAVDGCDTATLARGLCPSHYQRWRRYGDALGSPPPPPPPPPRVCSVDGCDRPSEGAWCPTHRAAVDLWPLPFPGLPEQPADDWVLDAACAGMDPELFYVSITVRGGARIPHPDAIAACASCPVRGDCLADDLAIAPFDRHGLRGGVWETDRRMDVQL